MANMSDVYYIFIRKNHKYEYHVSFCCHLLCRNKTLVKVNESLRRVVSLFARRSATKPSLEVAVAPALHNDSPPNKKTRARAVSEEELIPYALIDTLASKCKCCSWHSGDANGLICENEHQTTDF